MAQNAAINIHCICKLYCKYLAFIWCKNAGNIA